MGRTYRIRKNKRGKRKADNLHYFDKDSFQKSHVVQFSQLIRWMVCNGFKGAFLQLAEFQGSGRGLKATADFKPGDTLVSIPHKLLITSCKVLESELGTLMKRHNCKMTSQQMLSVFLLFEESKGTSSFWYPYLTLLPKRFNTTAFYSEEELQLLPKGSYISAKSHMEKVSNAYKELYSFFEVLKVEYPDLITNTTVSYGRFQWAWYAVSTRCVYMEQPEKGHDNCVMAPFLDLLNHSPTVQTEAGFDSSVNCYKIKTGTPFKKWQQVFICYGSHGNDKLLLEYGFVTSNNQNSVVKFDIDDIVDCLDVNLTDKAEDILLSKKLQIIKMNSLQRNLFCGLDGLSWCLSTALKIICMDSHEIKTWNRVYSSSSISTGCENRTVHLTMKLLKHHLHCNQVALKKIEDATSLLKSRGHLDIIQNLIQERQHMIENALRKYFVT